MGYAASTQYVHIYYVLGVYSKLHVVDCYCHHVLTAVVVCAARVLWDARMSAKRQCG